MAEAHSLTARDPAGPYESSVPMCKTDSAGVVKYKYGIEVPDDPRRQKIFYGHLEMWQEDALIEAAASLTPWKKTGEHAGILHEDFKYIMELGKAGHPKYADILNRMVQARSYKRHILQAKVIERAEENEDLAIKVLEMEERDRWTRETERQSEINKTVINGPVTIVTNFGDEVDVDHGFVPDAEFEECDD